MATSSGDENKESENENTKKWEGEGVDSQKAG